MEMYHKGHILREAKIRMQVQMARLLPFEDVTANFTWREEWLDFRGGVTQSTIISSPAVALRITYTAYVRI